MGIFKRISDIISANFNELAEGYENPELMLKQAIREMEEAIHQAKPDVARTMANEKTIAKELAANGAQVEIWAKRATESVAAGDDDLARKALVRKLEYEKIVVALRDQHAAAADASQMLRHQLEAMQAKLKDAQRRLGTLTARQKAADARTRMAQAQVGLKSDLDQDAFDKFDRLSRRVERAEAEAEAFAELARSERSSEDPTPSLETSDDNSEIEAELKKLKAQKSSGE